MLVAPPFNVITILITGVKVKGDNCAFKFVCVDGHNKCPA